LAVVATQAKGKTVIKGAGELRVKETDRIKAIVDELKKMNADIIERADGFIVNGPTTLHGGVFSSHNDHRIAMSLSIAGLLAQNQSIIENSECINISFPGFEQVLQYLIE
jgi:3-phosphoshikimate 1-carboxyvinyltransferase